MQGRKVKGQCEKFFLLPSASYIIKIFGSKIVAAENLVVDHVNAGEDVFIVVNKDYVSSGIYYAHNSDLNIFVP